MYLKMIKDGDNGSMDHENLSDGERVGEWSWLSQKLDYCSIDSELLYKSSNYRFLVWTIDFAVE